MQSRASTRFWIARALFLSMAVMLTMSGTPSRGDDVTRPTVRRRNVPTPSIAMPTGETMLGPGQRFPVRTENVRRVRLTAVPIEAQDLDEAARATGIHRPNVDPLALLPLRIRERARTKVFRRLPLRAHTFDVDPFELAGAQQGLLFVTLDAPGTSPRAAIVQRSSRSVLLKTGRTGGLVWVADLAANAVVPNADVTIYDGTNARFQGRTDASGLLRLPSRSELRGGETATWESPPLRAVAKISNDVAYTSERFSTGLERWQFNLPYAYYTGEHAVRGMLTAERGIYRPGETVHLLGVLRSLTAEGTLVPVRESIAVEVMDPEGNPVARRDVVPTEFGTFRMEVPVERTARLGRYSTRARVGEAEVSSEFDVAEYRTSTFEVQLAAGEGTTAGQRVTVPVRARYFYGAPVRGGRVQWSASWRESNIRVASAASMELGDSDDANGLRYLTSGELVLDREGNGTIELPAASFTGEERTRTFGKTQAVDLVFEASVTDAAEDVITARAMKRVALQETLAAASTDHWVVNATSGWTVQVMATDARGRAVARKPIVVRLYRRVYRAAPEEYQGRTYYRSTWEDVLVSTQRATSDVRPIAVRLALPGGGEYRVETSIAGSEGAAKVEVWAYGEGASTPVENHPRVELIKDRERYAPGDTAHIVAASPYAQSLALVTVERSGVMDARVLTLRGSETPIDVSLREQHLPNVFVSVTMLPNGATGLREATGIPFRLGYTELLVSPARRRLKIEVQPVATRARPRDQADVRVKVTDRRGRPVQAEVTLWAADEGVLQLTGYATPDPFAPAYARHDLDVDTASNVARWVQFAPDAWDDGSGGDSGEAPDANAAFRSRFLSTAFFSEGVVTDRNGLARVRFELPDNLTRWRVIASAADRGERFGSGDAAIAVSKPLAITPSLPRFLTQGDVVDAGVLVQNQTGRRESVQVRIAADGVTVVDASTKRIELANGDQQLVRFRLRAPSVGTAKLRAEVVGASERDGFALELPVNPSTSWVSMPLGEGRATGTNTISFTMPHDMQAGQAELVATMSSSVLASMERGMEALLEYPHGCVEQTTSRLIPMVLLDDLLRQMDPGANNASAQRARLEEAVAHVLRHQNDDGGFGLWPDSDSEGFLTAYALWGLLTARDHGYAVPAPRVANAVRYLRAHTGDGTDMHGQFADSDTRPFAAYVLARAEQSDDSLSRSLARDERTLSRFSVGLLAGALEGSERNTASSLVDALARSQVAVRGGKLVREPVQRDASVLGYGRDLRATSSAVEALLATGRRTEAEGLIAGIMTERSAAGDWGTTYNNLWAIHALSAYAEADSAQSRTSRVSFDVGGAHREVQLGGQTRVQRVVLGAAELPAAGGAGRITVRAPNDSRVRYAMRLRYVVDPRAHRATNHGFGVSRAMYDAETGAVVSAPRLGQVLRIRLSIRVPEDRKQVALVDRLPAGLEPIDMSLATEQRRQTESGMNWYWRWREIHDERVSFFADELPSGTHTVEYLARATRPGRFVRPPASAEAMYDPNLWGSSNLESIVVE